MKLTRSIFMNILNSLPQDDEASKVALLTSALMTANSYGYEMPDDETLMKWTKPKRGKKSDEEKEREAEQDAHLKTLGHDRSKWTEYVENVVPFKRILDADDKYSSAFYKLVNPEGGQQAWELRPSVRTLDGPGLLVYEARKDTPPKELVNDSDVSPATREFLSKLRDEYNSLNPKEDFVTWADQRPLPMEVTEVLHNKYNPNASIRKQEGFDKDHWLSKSEKAVGFIPFGRNEKGEQRKLTDLTGDEIKGWLEFNKPSEKAKAFPYHTKTEYDDMNRLDSVANLDLARAAKKLGIQSLADMALLVNKYSDIYGVDKLGGIKPRGFVKDPLDLSEIIKLEKPNYNAETGKLEFDTPTFDMKDSDMLNRLARVKGNNLKDAAFKLGLSQGKLGLMLHRFPNDYVVVKDKGIMPRKDLPEEDVKHIEDITSIIQSEFPKYDPAKIAATKEKAGKKNEARNKDALGTRTVTGKDGYTALERYNPKTSETLTRKVRGEDTTSHFRNGQEVQYGKEYTVNPKTGRKERVVKSVGDEALRNQYAKKHEAENKALEQQRKEKTDDAAYAEKNKKQLENLDKTLYKQYNVESDEHKRQRLKEQAEELKKAKAFVEANKSKLSSMLNVGNIASIVRPYEKE